MPLLNTWALDYTNKRIYKSAGSSVDTVNDLYSWVQDQIDELTALDDSVPMSAQTPTEYSLINGWYISEADIKALKGGALKTIDWNTNIYLVTFGATYTNAVASDVGKVVAGPSAFAGVLLGYDNTRKVWWVRKTSGTPTAGAYTITSGTGAGTATAVATGENLWANLYTLGSIESGTQLYIEQNGATLTSWWSTGHVDVLLLVKEMGTEIDGALVTVFAREWTDLYDWFEIDLTAGGRNAVPIATSDDLNNATASATVAAWSDVTVTFGTASKNLNNGNGAKNYDVVIDCGGRTLAQVYERLKYITRRGASGTLNGAQAEHYVSANAAYTPVKQSPFGTFAGGKFFGARGVWLENYNGADAKNFQLIAADGTTQVPPNSVSATVNGVVSGDRVGVFRLTGAGGTINKAKYTLAAGNNLGNATVVVSGSIASDEPQAGVVRIGDDRYTYTSWSGSTFTISGTLSQNYSAGASAWVPIVDAQAAGSSVFNSLIYSADIPVLVRVRKKGILPFEVEGTIASTGLTVSAIRTTDTIVT